MVRRQQNHYRKQEAMTDSPTRVEVPQGAKDFSRRKFIKGVGAVWAAGALLAVDCGLFPRTANAASSSDSSSTLQRSTFARYLNQTFRVYPDSGRQIDVRLTGVLDLPATAIMSKRDVTRAYREACFLLVFAGPGGQPLAQGSFRVEHPQMGRFDLFMVPTRETESQYYEAIFNRLVA